jgi:hypothetical protein
MQVGPTFKVCGSIATIDKGVANIALCHPIAT